MINSFFEKLWLAAKYILIFYELEDEFLFLHLSYLGRVIKKGSFESQLKI